MEKLGQLAQRFGVEGLKSGACRTDTVKVDISVGEVDPHSLAVSHDAHAVCIVDGTTELAQAPPKATPWIIGDVPEKLAQLLPSMLSPRGRQIT
jgi:hypothetical protein